MRIVILTGCTSSGVFGGTVPERSDEYLHGPEGQALLSDADVIVAIWPPSDEPIVVRAPEGVTIEAFKGHWAGRKVRLHPSITEQEFRDRMAADL